MESSSPASAVAVLERIHNSRTSYEEIKALYLGLFSRKPNNLWADNYTELRTDVLHELFDEDNVQQQQVFKALFTILSAGNEALTQCERAFEQEEAYRRFHERAKYRAYLALLTVAAMVPDQSLSARVAEAKSEAARMVAFLTSVLSR